MTKLKKVVITKWGKEYNKVFESSDVEDLFKELPELRTHLVDLDVMNVAARALSHYKGIEEIVLSKTKPSHNVVYIWLENIVYDRAELLAEFAANALKLLEEITAERKLSAIQHRVLACSLIAGLFDADFLVLNGIFVNVETLYWLSLIHI